eukprot:COSAG02_NODE_4018_length_5900_cov_6.102741_3_plen_87_part_00
MALLDGARAVTAEDNLFDQKSHANPLGRLMEIVANSVEHGGATHVRIRFLKTYVYSASSVTCRHIVELYLQVLFEYISCQTCSIVH